MVVAGLVALCINVPRGNEDAGLRGQQGLVIDRAASHFCQVSVRDSEETHLYGNPETILVAAMLSHKNQIRFRKRILADQLSLIIRECQQLHSVGRSEDFAARHRFAA